MAGIYIHIPFCTKACHYCNFHFSTSTHHIERMVAAIVQEINTLPFPAQDIDKNIETIYFGGGTPSVLNNEQLQSILNACYEKFLVTENAEITLEANPDDITRERLKGWRQLGFNRLSIGVQSFADSDLKWMNRAHNSATAADCIAMAYEERFEHLTIDLIYGTPTLSNEQLLINLKTAVNLGINHISCYALTVEENTALDYFIKKGKIAPVNEEVQDEHFHIMRQYLTDNGFEHYEISNFAKPGHRSRHNSNYWSGRPYYGFGPSAHSFNGDKMRWWNIANNVLYMDGIEKYQPVYEVENLTQEERINEIIMTGLRTTDGLHIDEANNKIGAYKTRPEAFLTFISTLRFYIAEGKIIYKNNTAIINSEHRFLSDGIASDLFLSYD